MKLRRIVFWDRFFSVLSWSIVIFLLWAALGLWLYPPTGAGPVAGAVGILASQIFYSFLYAGEAATLAYAKFKHKKKLRKNTLLVIYLTGMFTFLLSFLIIGFHIKILDNFAFSMFAGVCWLYWKAKTEYINPEQFKKIVAPMVTEEYPSVIFNHTAKHKK